MEDFDTKMTEIDLNLQIHTLKQENATLRGEYHSLERANAIMKEKYESQMSELRQENISLKSFLGRGGEWYHEKGTWVKFRVNDLTELVPYCFENWGKFAAVIQKEPNP